MRKRFYLNSLSGGIQLILNSLLIFAALPLMIKKLGAELYGIFSLLLLIGNLNTFINLGLNTTLIKFLAEQGKTRDSDKDILVSITLLLVLLIPISILCFIFSDFILLQILKIPLKYFTVETKTIYYLLLLSNILVLLGQIFSAVLDSIQKIYLSNMLQTVYNFLYWGLILTSLYLFNNLAGVGWGIFIAAVFWFISVAYYSLKSWGKLDVSGIKEEFWSCAKKQLSYSLKLYSSGVIGFFFEPFSKIMLAHFIGIREVGFLDVAFRFKTMIWNLITKILYPIFPYISSITDYTHLRNFIHDVEQKLAFLIIPVVAIVIYVTYPFVNIWLGKNVEIISISTLFITTAYLFVIIVLPVYQYFMVKGQPGKTVLMQSLNVIINGLVFLLAYKNFGYYGIIISNLSASASSLMLCLYYQKKSLNSLIFNDFRQLSKFVIILVLLLVSGFLLNTLLQGDIVKIIIFPLFFSVVSLLLYRLFNVFNENDVKKYFGNNPLQKFLSKLLIIS